MAEQCASFIQRLFKQTEDRKVNWYRLSEYSNLPHRSKELDLLLKYGNEGARKIFFDTSFFIKYNRGFVVLLHETYVDRPLDDGVSLYVIINENSTINCVSSYSEIPEEVRKIQGMIIKQQEQEPSLPQELYDFMNNCLPGDLI